MRNVLCFQYYTEKLRMFLSSQLEQKQWKRGMLDPINMKTISAYKIKHFKKILGLNVLLTCYMTLESILIYLH